MGANISVRHGVKSDHYYQPGNGVNEIWIGDKFELISRLPFGDSEMAQAAWPEGQWPKIPWRPFIIPLKTRLLETRSTLPEPYEAIWRQLLCEVLGGPYAHIPARASFVIWIILWLLSFTITYGSAMIYLRIRKATFTEKSIALRLRLYKLGAIIIGVYSVISTIVIVLDGYALSACLHCGSYDFGMIGSFFFIMWCIPTVLMVSLSTGMSMNIWSDRSLLQSALIGIVRSIPTTTAEEGGGESGVAGSTARARDHVASDQPPQYESDKAQVATEQESKEECSGYDEMIAMNEIRPAESAHVRPIPRGCIP